jgi:hypothetical protein
VQLAIYLAEHEMIRAAGRKALEECLRERLAGEGRAIELPDGLH